MSGQVPNESARVERYPVGIVAGIRGLCQGSGCGWSGRRAEGGITQLVVEAPVLALGSAAEELGPSGWISGSGAAGASGHIGSQVLVVSFVTDMPID